MEFWITREADGFSTESAAATWTADSSGAPMLWNALGIFPDPPYRTTVPVTFAVNADTRGSHDFSVRQSDGYVMGWFNPSYASGSNSSWDDMGVGNPLSVVLLYAQVDPTKGWWLRDETAAEDLPSGQTEILDGWTPMHSEPPPTPILTVQLPVWRDPGYIGISPSPHQYSAYLGDFPATAPSMATFPGTDLMADYSIASITITIENQFPYNTSFTLGDTITGQSHTFQGASPDLRHWFGPTQPLALHISSSRWAHELLLRHPNGDSYPIVKHATMGSVSFTPSGNAWQTTYYYFDATASHHPELPWYVEDLATGDRIGPNPGSADLINWIVLPAPASLTGTLTPNGVVNLEWPIGSASTDGGFSVERRLNDSGPWIKLGTIAAVSRDAGDILHFADNALIVGMVHSYRTRYAYGGSRSLPSNVIRVTGWMDSDGDGMPDLWETANSLNPSDANDASADADGDGQTNAQEAAAGTNPNSSDSDSDNSADGADQYPPDARRHTDIPKTRYASIDLLAGQNIPDYERYSVLNVIDDTNRVGLYIPYGSKAGTWQNGVLTLREITRWVYGPAQQLRKSRQVHAVNSLGTVAGDEWQSQEETGTPYARTYGYLNRLTGEETISSGPDIDGTTISHLADSGAFAGLFTQWNHSGHFTGSTFVSSVTSWREEPPKLPQDGSLVHIFGGEAMGAPHPRAVSIAEDGSLVGPYQERYWYEDFGPLGYARFTANGSFVAMPPGTYVTGMNSAGTMFSQVWAGPPFAPEEPFISPGQTVRSMLPAKFAAQIGQIFPGTITDGGVLIFAAEILNPDPSGAEWINARLLLDPRTTPPALRDITSIPTTTMTRQINSNGWAVDRGYLLLPVAIVPDFNRDGVINDQDRGKVTEAEPWRWWLNDDDDSGEVKQNDAPGSGPDAKDSGVGALDVDGSCDLLDFFPLYFDIKKLIEVLPPEQAEYRLVHENAAVNFVYTDLTAGEAGKYLRDAATADQLKSATSYPTPASGAGRLTTEFLNKIKNEDGKGVPLIEGSNASDKPLWLEVWKGGQKVCEVKFQMKVDGVEKMYRWVNLRGVANGGSVGRATDTGEPPNRPDRLTTDKHFVFVHGYNVSEDQARGWNAEMFKRLYQSGLRAKFTAVVWRGNQDQLGTITPEYWENVTNAFITSPHVATAVGGLAGTKIIAGHSLGNMVVTSAIKDHGMSVSQYFQTDAAVALQAYDQTIEHRDQMRHPSWQHATQGYYPDRLWSAYWHTLFAGSDGRNKLTWRQRFGPIANAHNFYSTGEEVLDNATGAVPSLGSHWAWTLQEMVKGTDHIGSVATLDKQGGWGFNPAHFKSITINTPDEGDITIHVPREPNETGAITAEMVKTEPFFTRFQDQRLMNAAQGSAAANEYHTRAKTLAEGIPSLSWAAGRNAIDNFEDQNTDLMTLKTGWPRGDGKWLHSDVGDVAFRYNHLLFKRWIDLGGLK